MSKLTSEEWDYICFAEQFWRENRCFPSDAEISVELKVNRALIAQWNSSPLVQKHLAARGIDWKKDKLDGTESSGLRKGAYRRLSDIQLAVASSILNPADRRSIPQKLEALGVSPATYNGWKKSKVFSEFMKSQSEELFSETLPDIHNSVLTRASSGDIRAAKLVYEMTGIHRGDGSNSDSVGDVKYLIIKLIEVLQKHIKDPVVLSAIAADIQSFQNHSSPQDRGVSNAIESSFDGSVSSGLSSVSLVLSETGVAPNSNPNS